MRYTEHMKNLVFWWVGWGWWVVVQATIGFLDPRPGSECGPVLGRSANWNWENNFLTYHKEASAADQK